PPLHGKVHDRDGARPDAAVDDDGAEVLAHDRLRNGKPETRAPRTRGEERIEHAGEAVGGNAVSGVLEPDLDVVHDRGGEGDRAAVGAPPAAGAPEVRRLPRDARREG